MDTQQKKRPAAGRSPRTAKRPAPKQAVKQETKRPAPQQRRRSNTRNRRTTGPSRRELESKLLRQNANVRTNRRRVSSPKRYTQPVVYTQPKVFNRNRLLLQLLIICASVLAMVLAMSVFFKVDVIKVSGAKAYSEWDVREASGI